MTPIAIRIGQRNELQMRRWLRRLHSVAKDDGMGIRAVSAKPVLRGATA